ncbi:MAG: archease [Candidatus Omnitrophota bacterium]
MKDFELIEHTADIGIRVKAGSLDELFRKAAFAMFQMIAEPKGPTTQAAEEIPIKLNAENIEQLFVNWLNELLSLSATKELIFTSFKVLLLEHNRLETVACGAPMEDFRINAEIKAATYHELKLEETASGWAAEVIFDV